MEEEILANPIISAEFRTYEELASDYAGHELDYLDLVTKEPISMDSATLAFSLSGFMRLSTTLMEKLLGSLNEDETPDLKEILENKGIDLDKSQAQKLRNIIFAFRDCEDEETRGILVRAFQIMTISRQRRRVILNLGESYKEPEEGWLEEDFGGDDSLLETVRSVEDPRWNEQED
ncbi:MAG: hypothetical protein M1511_11120 [Deltaproteobacteria bacterium]|nr:hypothetical protein [Deltaproteobacteria bacterium]